MINLLDPTSPTPDDIHGARVKAKLTQQAAADLIGYSRRGWQDAESGRNNMLPAAWALFLLATGQHPSAKVEQMTTAWYDPSTKITYTDRDDAPRGAQIWPVTR